MKLKHQLQIIILLFVMSACIKQKEPTLTLLNDRFFTTNVDISPVEKGDYAFYFIATDVDGNIGSRALVVTIQ